MFGPGGGSSTGDCGGPAALLLSTVVATFPQQEGAGPNSNPRNEGWLLRQSSLFDNNRAA